jgi:dihydroorotate dehydrogenase
MWYPRSLLFRLAPETAHRLTLSSLRYGQTHGLLEKLLPPVLEAPCTLMGLTFPNPVGLAAGLDKDGECIDAWRTLGFGFVEIGTVTPRPQPGNAQPRLFRLPAAQALINRMGFNNGGIDALLDNVRQARHTGILGINLGKNASTPLENAADDYLIGLRKAYPHADYVTINLSSPNTPGLRQLQHGEALRGLLRNVKHHQSALAEEYGKYAPLLIKLAPDLEADDLRDIIFNLMEFGIDGVIATNTTLSRHGVEHLKHAEETGGLSGAPLFERATQMVADIHRISGGELPIIAAGGIMSAQQAVAKIQAGASLVQLYSGLIYHGPALIKHCVDALRPLNSAPTPWRGNKHQNINTAAPKRGIR